MPLVQGMHANAQSVSGLVSGSEEFVVKVNVQQGLVLRPLLFIFVLEASLVTRILLWGPLGGPLCQ